MNKFNNIKNGNFEWRQYLGKLATVAIILFLFFIQFVSTGWNKDAIKSAEFWTNLVINFSLAIITYTIWLYDYKVKSQHDLKYTTVVGIFTKLINQVFNQGQVAELREYADVEVDKRLERIQRSRVLATGFTVEEYDKLQLRFMSKRQLRKTININGKDIKLTSRQRKLILASQKKARIEPIDTTYLTSDISDEKAYTLRFNEPKQIRKFIYIKAIKFMVWAVFAASIALSQKETTFLEVMAWVSMRLVAMMFAMWGGSNDGTHFTTVLKRSYFKYCIDYMVGFFAWHEATYKTIKWAYPDMSGGDNLVKEKESNTITNRANNLISTTTTASNTTQSTVNNDSRRSNT